MYQILVDTGRYAIACVEKMDTGVMKVYHYTVTEFYYGVDKNIVRKYKIKVTVAHDDYLSTLWVIMHDTADEAWEYLCQSLVTHTGGTS